MKIKFISIVDGALVTLGLMIVDLFFLSPLAHSFDYAVFLYIALGFAVFSSIIYLLYVIKISDNRQAFFCSLISFSSFVITFVLFIVIHASILVRLFPTRIFNNVDGLMIIIMFSVLICSSVVSRFIIFLSLILKNTINRKKKNKTNDKTGDGSVSRT